MPNPVVTWIPTTDGQDGGLIGWALGSLLLAGLGYWLALLLVVLMAVAGFALLVRYTPLIYLAAAVARALPGLRRFAPGLQQTADAAAFPEPTHTANFVSAAPQMQSAAPVPADGPGASGQAPPTQRRKGSSQGAAPSPKAAEPEPAAAAAKTTSAAARTPRRPATLPSIELLDVDAGAYGNTDVALLEEIILRTLADFNVPARVVHVETGPTVTQFGIEPLYTERAGQKRKVRVNRIVSLANDLALALAAPAIRIEAPVPGRPYVGIEVPNVDKSLVSLRGIIASPELRKGGMLALPLGRNTSGQPVVMDLTKAPHMLIAGATGSGKSVCINTIITGLLMQHGPEQLRFVMVDPKMVELPGYNGIPHLYGKVITDVEQVMGALTWLLLQMDDRYQLFRDAGVRNIDAYNEVMRKQKGGALLPYIVLVVDELADLMMTAADDVERQILPAGPDGSRHGHSSDPGHPASER